MLSLLFITIAIDRSVTMVTIADDIQRIFSDKTDQFANRKSFSGLIGVSAGLLVVVVALSAALGVASYTVARWNWLYGGDRCATADCLRTAAWIADSVNLDADGAINTSGSYGYLMSHMCINIIRPILSWLFLFCTQLVLR